MAIVKLTYPAPPTVPTQYNKQNQHLAVLASKGYNSKILQLKENAAPVIKQNAVIRHAKEVYLVTNEAYVIDETSAVEGYLIVSISGDSLIVKWEVSVTGFTFDPDRNGFYDMLDNQLLREFSQLDGTIYTLSYLNGNNINQKVLEDGRFSYGTEALYSAQISNIIINMFDAPGYTPIVSPTTTYYDLTTDDVNLMVFYAIAGIYYIDIINPLTGSIISTITLNHYPSTGSAHRMTYDGTNFIGLRFLSSVYYIDVYDGTTGAQISTTAAPWYAAGLSPIDIFMRDGNLVLYAVDGNISPTPDIYYIKTYDGVDPTTELDSFKVFEAEQTAEPQYWAFRCTLDTDDNLIFIGNLFLYQMDGFSNITNYYVGMALGFYDNLQTAVGGCVFLDNHLIANNWERNTANVVYYRIGTYGSTLNLVR